MLSVSSQNKIELETQGWTIIDMEIDADRLNLYRDAILRLRDKAFISKYPIGRVYFPHFRSLNIAGIESIFNNLIVNEDIKSFFRDLQLGKVLRELMGWSESHLELIRLFTMGNYKYRGNWHRDSGRFRRSITEMNEIQMAIYVQEDSGFKIFKPEMDINGNDQNAIKVPPESSPHLPLKISSLYYTEINARPGSVLFFNPGLLHQGNTKSERLDFHLRFLKEPILRGRNRDKGLSYCKNDYLDFKFLNIYDENYDLSQDRTSARIGNHSLMKRVGGSINYYTGILNIRNHLLYLSQSKDDSLDPWKFDLFANTIFQSSHSNQ